MEKTQLERTFTMYYREVYLYALSLCGNSHEAEELVSDTFYQALLSFGGQDTAVKYWLFRVCKNLFLDRMRAAKRHKEVPLEETAEDRTLNVLERLIQKEEARALYREILRLPDAGREAVCMYYFMNYSIKEIAYATGRPEGAVKTALCRARARLKHRMEEEKA